MAECVYKNLENMLPELEDLETKGIFDKNELRIILKKRTELEYKLQRRIVAKKDFLKYLEYELNVDSLRKKRMQRLGLRPKHTAAEIGINKRIHHIFQKALKKFGNDLKLWMQYIDFCKKTASKHTMGRILGRLMQIHSQNPSVWIMSAKWEFEENSNIDNARTLMQKSLRQNPECKTLWLEYFRLELLHVDKIKKRKEFLTLTTEGDQVEQEEIPELFLANKTASIVYKNAIQQIPNDVGFRVEFLSIYRLFQDTDENQNEVYESLKEDFPLDEAAYGAIARRDLDSLQAKNTNGSTISDDDWKKAENGCRELFKEAVKKFGTGSMYEVYLKTFLELVKLEGATGEQVTRRIKIVLDILIKADKCGSVTEEMFLAWSELLLHLEDAEGVVEILSKAVNELSTPSLCERYLSVISQVSENSETLDNEFEKCIKRVGEKDSSPLWELWMTTCLEGDAARAVKVFEMSLTANKHVAELGRLKYLEWTYETKGIKEFRKLFKGLKDVCPLTPEILDQALDFENQQEARSLSRIRKLHELTVDSFGKISIDCWLKYIAVEQKQETTAVDTVGGIYWRALKTLDSKLVAEFIDKYTLLKTNS